MEIKRIGSQPSVTGPSEWSTGTVRIDPLFQAPDPALVQVADVTFQADARTAGIRIRSVRPSSSRKAAVGSSAKADQSRRSGRVMWAGSRPAAR